MIKNLFILIVISIPLISCGSIGKGFAYNESSISYDTKASWYSLGGRTASGEIVNHKNLTAAHKTLPFGTLVKITNVDNNKSTVVRINDRGPFLKGRDLDVSKQVAVELDFIKKGIVRVKYQIVTPKKL